MLDNSSFLEKAGLKNAERLVSSPDSREFLNARNAVLSESLSAGGIGTLSEKSTHKMLKIYIDPNEEHHERQVMSKVADIYDGDRIFEIQTRSYERLVPKLSEFLGAGYRVTVVCPISAEKTVRWLDPESGEITKPRKSTKAGSVYDALFNLYRIKDFLREDGLSVRLLFMKAEEYKYLDGWDKSKKKGSSRKDNIPLSLICRVDISSIEDIALFVPDSLGEEFTAAEFSRAIKRNGRFSYYVIKLLIFAGAISLTDRKRGRAFLYKKNI